MTTPVLQSAIVEGDILTLTYNDLLDEGSQPASCYFQVNVNGQNRSVANLSINGNTVILSLNASVSNGDTVTFNYSDPSASNDTYAIQNLAGEDAANLTNQAVTNATSGGVDITAPSLVSASFSETINSLITLTFNESMQMAAGNV